VSEGGKEGTAIAVVNGPLAFTGRFSFREKNDNMFSGRKHAWEKKGLVREETAIERGATDYKALVPVGVADFVCENATFTKAQGRTFVRRGVGKKDNAQEGGFRAATKGSTCCGLGKRATQD